MQRLSADSQIRILLINEARQEYARLSHMLAAIDVRRYRLTWCSDTTLAVEAMLSDLHDVILLDYCPETGQSLLASANHQGCSAPIIVMTEKMNAELDQAAIKAGAADYLIKNRINADLLERSIRYALDRKEVELKLAKIAHYDALSGVPNRVLFSDRLERAIQRAERGNHPVALLFLDFDGFKKINDTYGHAAGDGLIAVIAERLSACMRRTDSVARLGGDEFTVVLEDVHSIADIINVARKILQTIARPFPVAGHPITLGCSIGIAQYPEAGTDVATLLKNADLAMYQAKQVRGSAYRFYTDTMNAEAISQQNIEDELRNALQAGELQLYFQPRVDLRSGQIAAVESVLRWRHPSRGVLLAEDFMAAAETAGLATLLDDWVVDEACRALSMFSALHCEPLTIAVNVAVKSLQNEAFFNHLRRSLTGSGVDASYLQFELHESALMTQVRQTQPAMLAVNSLGLTFLLDRFGSGYSSFLQLQKLPITAVKIDRSMVQNLQHSEAGARIVKAMITLGKSLGLSVGADGVDTQEQKRFLQQNGCDQIQGDCFSPALSFDALCRLLGEKSLLAV